MHLSLRSCVTPECFFVMCPHFLTFMTHIFHNSYYGAVLTGAKHRGGFLVSCPRKLIKAEWDVKRHHKKKTEFQVHNSTERPEFIVVMINRFTFVLFFFSSKFPINCEVWCRNLHQTSQINVLLSQFLCGLITPWSLHHYVNSVKRIQIIMMLSIEIESNLFSWSESDFLAYFQLCL